MNAIVYQFPSNRSQPLRRRLVPAQVIAFEPRTISGPPLMLIGFSLFWFGLMLAWSRR